MARSLSTLLIIGIAALFHGCGANDSVGPPSGGTPSGGNGSDGGASGSSAGSGSTSSGGSTSSANAGAGDIDSNAGEGGDAMGEAGTAACAKGTPCAPVKRIFVTKNIYTGDLKSYVSGAASGLAAADALCNTSASSAGLSGSFRAWVSSSTVNAIDRLTDVGPWYVLGSYDSPRYANKAAIVVSSPGQINGISTGEDGSVVEINGPGGVIVWTGTASNGTSTNAAAPVTNCADWTSSLAVATGTYGFANRGVEDPSWTQFPDVNASCDGTAHLYCFEQ